MTTEPGGYQPADDAPVFVISIAAQIAGLHPQTLRQYDRLGLVSPDRVGGRNRLYSLRDIDRLREVSRLSSDGVNLAGIQRILELEARLERLQQTLDRLRDDRDAQPSTALVVWRPGRRSTGG
jgi:MerR family transcriptional regulator/heat shock protein HspR